MQTFHSLVEKINEKNSETNNYKSSKKIVYKMKKFLSISVSATPTLGRIHMRTHFPFVNNSVLTDLKLEIPWNYLLVSTVNQIPLNLSPKLSRTLLGSSSFAIFVVGSFSRSLTNWELFLFLSLLTLHFSTYFTCRSQNSQRKETKVNYEIWIHRRPMKEWNWKYKVFEKIRTQWRWNVLLIKQSSGNTFVCAILEYF